MPEADQMKKFKDLTDKYNELSEAEQFSIKVFFGDYNIYYSKSWYIIKVFILIYSFSSCFTY